MILLFFFNSKLLVIFIYNSRSEAGLMPFGVYLHIYCNLAPPSECFKLKFDFVSQSLRNSHTIYQEVVIHPFHTSLARKGWLRF